ncbi:MULTISPECIES: hypothetical protein [unclassified Mesorhizobium]|uniref:hypothetical protein n=1 Tax=unclassified Mesorhizobium TaxID=325217 RepID=UPI001093ED50|nr:MULTISPECIES: hypothetical protein [unclassified Mesorhizobium]TGS48513.1 hypothetical protein EN825_06225 [Mesorhizobium sp. M8A.F.Ca.ET.182.01.1.1]TGS83195.1 hypothetical protein EN824_01905 [Mesorhizobium sp. M8A.F.Ca.ET.181.01.1.1]
MWDALMLLRLIASASPKFSLGHPGRASHAALPGRASHAALPGRAGHVALPRRAGLAALPGRAGHAALPADTLKGAIRLAFAASRLSLPVSQHANGHGNHDRKIASDLARRLACRR